MTLFLRIVAVLFFLIGLLAGGCSLMFAPAIFNGDPSILPIWLAGFGVAFVFIWAAMAVWRSRD